MTKINYRSKKVNPNNKKKKK